MIFQRGEGISLMPDNYRNDIIEYLPNAYAYHRIILDEGGNPVDYIFLDANQAFEKITGLIRQKIIGKRVTQVIPELGKSEFDWIKTYASVALTGKSIKINEYSRALDKWYNVHAYSNKKGYFITIFDDISEEKETEFKLRNKEKELKEALSLARLGRWDFYHREDLLEWSDIIYEIFEKDSETFHVSYENFLGTIHREDREVVNKAWINSLANQESYTIDHRIIMEDGREKWVRELCMTDFDENGDPIHSIGIVQDISEAKTLELEKEEKQKEIEYLSFYDHLTKLYNRRFFEAEIKRLDTSRNLPISIIVGDVNGLKILNDSFGHSVGDELLVKMAEILKEACRADDIIARMGGDEFSILLPQTDEDGTKKIIARIKQLCSKEQISGVDISIALGYSIKEQAAEDIDEIIKLAENSMYEDKFLLSRYNRKRAYNDIINIIEIKYPNEREYFKRLLRLYDKVANRS